MLNCSVTEDFHEEDLIAGQERRFREIKLMSKIFSNVTPRGLGAMALTIWSFRANGSKSSSRLIIELINSTFAGKK